MFANVFALGAVADFGAKICQVTTKADARHNAELTTKTAIEPNACYALVAVFSALNLNRSEVFCSFFEGRQNILKLFLVYLIYMMYICTYETQLDKIHNLDKHRSWLLL